MIQTPKGREMVENMISTKAHIDLTLNEKDEPKEADGVTRINGITKLDKYRGFDPVTGETFDIIHVTIFLKNIQETSHEESYQKEEWERNHMTFEEEIGSTSVHEGTHATRHFGDNDNHHSHEKKEKEAGAEERQSIKEYGDNHKPKQEKSPRLNEHPGKIY